MTGSTRRLARTLALASLLVWIALAAAGRAHAQPQGRNVELLSHMDNYAGYSACWSYVHHDGREF